MSLQLWLQPRKFKELKKQILHVLEHRSDTRNSDILLTQTIWLNFYKEHIVRKPSFMEMTVKFDSMYSIPNVDDVKRIRALIQNPSEKKNYAGKFFPTVWKVAKARHWDNQIAWLKALKYNPEMLTPQQVAEQTDGKVQGEIEI